MARKPGNHILHGLSDSQQETEEETCADDSPDEPFYEGVYHQQHCKHESVPSCGVGRPNRAGGEIGLPSSDWCGYQRGPNPIRAPIPMGPIPILGPKPRLGPNPGPIPGPKAGSCTRCSGVRTSATAVRAASAFSCIW